MPRATLSTSYSFPARLGIGNRPGRLAKVLHSVAQLRWEPGAITNDELSEEYIVPGIFNKQVARRVAARRGEERRVRR
jgi:hypothetical protein